MWVRVAALLAAISLAVTFFVKGFNTILPLLYRHRTVAMAVSGSLTAAALLMLLFFIVMRLRFTKEGSRDLASATGIAIAGAVIAVLIRFRILLLIFGLRPISGTVPFQLIIAIGSFASAFALFWFFMALYVKARERFKGAGAGLAGSSVFVVSALFSLVLQVMTPATAIPRFVLLFALPFGLAAFGALFYFFVLVYYDRSWDEEPTV